MGIQDLYNFIKEYAPNVLDTYHLSKFSGCTFAIDISIFLNKYIKSAGDKNNVWVNQFIMLLRTLKKHSIKSVCVFDGPNPPIEKQIEQQRRRAEGKKAIDRMQRCIDIRKMLLEEYLPTDKEVEPELQEECKKLYGRPTKNIRVVIWSECTDVIDVLKSVIDRLEISSTPITDAHRNMAKKVVDMMGIPYFQADGEAEALCAYLAIHGYVDCVLTEDTDVLAYGAPWLLAFKDYKLSDEIVHAIHLPTLLDTVGYTQEEFRDLCILLSCDYNNRVKGYPPDGKNRKKPVCIGLKGAVEMINEYRTLEAIEDYVEDIEPLIYPRCREIFATPTNNETKRLIKIMPLNSPPKFKELEAFLKTNKLSITIDYIKECWKPGNISYIDDDYSNDEYFNNEDENTVSNLLSDNMQKCDTQGNGKYYVQLAVECVCGVTDKTKTIKVDVCFEDYENYILHCDSGFDNIIGQINEYLESKKTTKNLFIDGVIETIKNYGYEDKKPKGDIIYILEEK